MSEQEEKTNGVNVPFAMIMFRIMVAGLLAAHGWARMLADAVVPFGGYLDSVGFPFGLLIAWGITLLEIVGTILIMVGSRFIPYLCLVFIGIYATGIVLVHAPEGWFVVGLGRNGMEYSVLLIASLLLIAVSHVPETTKKRLFSARKNTDN